MRKSRAAKSSVGTQAPSATATADRLWAQVLTALWIAAIVVYYLRLQLLRFFQMVAR